MPVISAITVIFLNKINGLGLLWEIHDYSTELRLETQLMFLWYVVINVLQKGFM